MAAATAIAGSVLLAAGISQSRRGPRYSFAAAPTFTAGQATGASASLTIRF